MSRISLCSPLNHKNTKHTRSITGTTRFLRKLVHMYYIHQFLTHLLPAFYIPHTTTRLNQEAWGNVPLAQTGSVYTQRLLKQSRLWQVKLTRRSSWEVCTHLYFPQPIFLDKTAPLNNCPATVNACKAMVLDTLLATILIAQL
jgi:hypothetical protein